MYSVGGGLEQGINLPGDHIAAHQVAHVVDQQVELIRTEVALGRSDALDGHLGEQRVGGYVPDDYDDQGRQGTPEGGEHAVITGPGMHFHSRGLGRESKGAPVSLPVGKQGQDKNHRNKQQGRHGDSTN